jgi:hypothetical protein
LAEAWAPVPLRKQARVAFEGARVDSRGDSWDNGGMKERAAVCAGGLALALFVACTGKGLGKADARPAADAPPAADAVSCSYGSTTYAPGETYTVGCQRCSCLASGTIECVAGLCPVVFPDAFLPDRPDSLPEEGCEGAPVKCLYSGGALALGESGVDGCSTYYCGAGGKLSCMVGACAAMDAGAGVECALSTGMTFGIYGGFGVTDIYNVLDSNGTLTVDGGNQGFCVTQPPACGTPCAVTVATIARDLADPEVQAALALPAGTLFGARRGAGDVANFLITLGDGRSLLVGYPCCQELDLPCIPIPKGVQRLVNDLQAMLAAREGCG